MDKLKSITNDDVIMTELEAQKWDEWERNTIYNDEVNAGIEQGISQGIETTIVNTIKSMLKSNLDYKRISKVTNKNIAEIKEIEKDLTK